MSKNNLHLQKILFYAFLITGAGLILAALLFSGFNNIHVANNGKYADIAFSLSGMEDVDWASFGSYNAFNAALMKFAKNIQVTNNFLFYSGLASLSCSAVAGILGNCSRKNYYLSNFIITIIILVVGVATSAVIIFKSITLIADFADVEPVLAQYATMNNLDAFTPASYYTGIIFPVLHIASTVLLGLFSIKKYFACKKSLEVKNESVTEMEVEANA